LLLDYIKHIKNTPLGQGATHRVEVQDAAVKGIDLTENLLLDKEEIVEEVDTTEEVQEENGGEICGLDSETSNQIRLAYDEFTANVEELTDMLDGTLEGFSDDLRSLISLTQNIDDSLDTADIFFYILIAISVVIICIVAAMLAAVFFAIKGWENTFTRIIKGALLWPFFIFFLLLSWIFATLFLVFSLAGADFCVDPGESEFVLFCCVLWCVQYEDSATEYFI